MNHRFLLVAVLCLSLLAPAVSASPLSKAAKKGKLSRVRELIQSGADVDERDRGGNSPIYQAALKGHADVVRALAEAGADVDVDNNFGSTPLHVASRAGHVDVIRVLAEFGADLNVRNLSGGTKSERGIEPGFTAHQAGFQSSTPLEKAARAGRLEAVKVLIELGAELPARGAVEQAKRKKHKEVAAYITKATMDRRKSPTGASPPPMTPKTFEFTADYRRKVAAVIGISRYTQLDNLEGARNDAKEVAEVLRTLGFDKVFELYDEDATRARMLEVLGQRLREETTKDDLAFVFFAGHGATETLSNGEKRGYLIPTEGSTRDAFVSGVSMETIQDLSNRLAAKHVYYAVDACYSGGLVETPSEGIASRGGKHNQSVQVLTAGLEGQQAIEKGGRGIFTTYLIQALSGEANRNGDKVVTATEIGWFVADQVGQATRGRQTPAFGRLGGTGEIAFPIR